MVTVRRSAHALVSVVVLALGLTTLVGYASSASVRLNPISISFSSAHAGEVLSLYDCAGATCAALEQTGDLGARWHGVPLPASLSRDLAGVAWGLYDVSSPTLSVHFADARDGWLFGDVPGASAGSTRGGATSRLWATHNGGVTWTEISLDALGVGGGVISMATHNTVTYLYGRSALSATARLLASPSAKDAWVNDATLTLPVTSGSARVSGDFTFAGTDGWFVSGSSRGYLSWARLASNGSWVAWTGGRGVLGTARYAPLASVPGGDLVAVTSRASGSSVASGSAPARWQSGASWTFVSHDAGRTFRAGRPLSASASVQYPPVLGLPAAPQSGTLMVEQEDATHRYRLVRSTNDARNWRVVLNARVVQVDMVDATSGFAIAVAPGNGSASVLERTSDAGAHWSSLPL